MSSPEVTTFYSQHQERLGRLFQIVGVPVHAAESLETAVEATQPWVRGDHIKPEQRFQINPSDTSELHGLFDEFGLVQEHALLPRHYDELLLLGGTYWGNHHRLKFLKKVLEAGGVTTDKVTLLGGERPMFTEEIPAVRKDMDSLDESQIVNVEDGAGSVDIYWETDMLRLAAIKQFGSIVMQLGYGNYAGGSPDRPHIQEFTWDGIPFELMHTKAVERNGEARHTTESCMADWLQTTAPKYGAAVGFLAANPHTTRVSRSAYTVLDNHDRGDIALVPAGPAALSTIKHHTYLGEIGRHLYEDRRLSEARGGLAARGSVAG